MSDQDREIAGLALEDVTGAWERVIRYLHADDRARYFIAVEALYLMHGAPFGIGRSAVKIWAGSAQSTTVN